MASSAKSQKLGLSLWEPSDKPERLDFRQDNEAIETLVGAHLSNEALHMTAGEKTLLQHPYYIDVYEGTGGSVRTSYATTLPRVKAIFVFALGRPPEETDGQGVRHVYWDFCVNTDRNSQAYLSHRGGVVMLPPQRWTTYSRASGVNQFHLNDSGQKYLVVMFPWLNS